MTSTTFKIGDLVWAKARGYAPWPGQIRKPPEGKKRKDTKPHFYIFFFGTENFGWVGLENLWLYEEKKEEFSNKKDEDPCLEMALNSIEHFITYGEIPKDDSSQEENSEEKKEELIVKRKRKSEESLVDVSSTNKTKVVKKNKDTSKNKEEKEKTKLEEETKILEKKDEAEEKEEDTGIPEFTRKDEFQSKRVSRKRNDDEDEDEEEDKNDDKSKNNKLSEDVKTNVDIDKNNLCGKIGKIMNLNKSLKKKDTKCAKTSDSFSTSNSIRNIKTKTTLNEEDVTTLPDVLSTASTTLTTTTQPSSPVKPAQISSPVKSKTITTKQTTSQPKTESKFSSIKATNKKIGLIGCGQMGCKLGQLLLTTRHYLAVWNRTSSKYKELVKNGAKGAKSLKDIIQNSDIIIFCLTDDEAFKQVFYDNEFLKYVGENKILINMTTVDFETTLDAYETTVTRGGSYVECVMVGTCDEASKGQLLLLVYGEGDILATILSITETFSRRVILLSDIGTGSKLSLIVNMMLATSHATLAESLSLASKVGLDPCEVVSVVHHTSFVSEALKKAGKDMVQNVLKSSVDIPLSTLQNCMRLAINKSDEVDQPLHVASAVNELLKRARAKGYGDADAAAVYRAVQF